jgi:hypothetical protein
MMDWMIIPPFNVSIFRIDIKTVYFKPQFPNGVAVEELKHSKGHKEPKE